MQSKCFCQFQLECKGKTGTADLDTVNNDVCRVNSDHAPGVGKAFRVGRLIVIHLYVIRLGGRGPGNG